MFRKQKDIEGTTIENRWNGLNPRERYKLILEHPDHFLSLGLVTNDELERVMSASETELEYIIERGYPLFQKVDLMKKIATQFLSRKVKAAVQAVFLEFSPR